MAHSATLGACTVRQIHSKNVALRLEHMRWSHRMDLMCAANEKGEVVVYRLNLQKTWVHPPPQPELRVRGVDWRPGEKIVAVGYSNGWVALLDIENQHEIYSFQLNGDIQCLNWTQNNREIVDDSDSDNPLNNHDTYLPPLPSFSSLTSNARKTDYNATSSTYSKKIINLLIVGLSSGMVHLFAFGVLPCGVIDVAANLGSTVRILDARLSADFRQLQVTVLHKPSQSLQLVTYVNEALKQHLWPLLQLANKHGHILNTMQYIEDIIQCISEAWETALLEMDNMLTRYASAHPAGSVSADFLELLVYGYPSDALEEFLTRDLTEKGLKKLGNSIEISYSTIQKLVIKPLHIGILNVCYHLNGIKGMARNVYYYRPLLGTPNNAALENAGAFLIKSLELQQTIEQSTRDYKLFWCWLYGVVIRLMEEVVPDDVAAFSQQDIIYLAEFLNNFDAADDVEEEDPCGEGEVIMSTTGNNATTPNTPSNKKRFNLERVGQYLQNAPLPMPTTVDLTQKWHQLLDDNACLKQCDLIYPHDRSHSLVQQHDILKRSIAELFALPETMIGGNFERTGIVECCSQISAHTEAKELHQRTAHVNNTALGCSWMAMLISPEEAVIVETTADGQRAVKLSWQGPPPPQTTLESSPSSCHSEPGSPTYASFGPVIEFRDLAFYNEEWLSMLLFNAAIAGGESATNCWLNFHVRSVRDRMQDTHTESDFTGFPAHSMYELVDAGSIRRIEHGDSWRMAVSGSRKLVTVVSDSGRRVRVYETEVDEDEDEGLDASQSSAGMGEVSRESEMRSEEEDEEDVEVDEDA